MSKKKATTLGRWIDSYGTAKLAKRLKVRHFTAYQWRRSKMLPRYDQMLKIKKLSGISTDTMLTEFEAQK